MTRRMMREPTFLILMALASGDRHGYGIIADIERMSSGRVRLRAGTLYSTLDRLRADGLVRVDRQEVVESGLRRCYRLTLKGEQRLAGEAARFHSDATAALARRHVSRDEAVRPDRAGSDVLSTTVAFRVGFAPRPDVYLRPFGCTAAIGGCVTCRRSGQS